MDCLGIRISYTGELGWVLYPAMKDMDAVYQAIVDNGADLGLEHVGTRVINTLRVEKGLYFLFVLCFNKQAVVYHLYIF